MFKKSEKSLVPAMIQSPDCSAPSLFARLSWLLRVINLLVPELFFLILAHPVYKMRIIQEPNMLELWNKLYFEEEKTESIRGPTVK